MSGSLPSFDHNFVQFFPYIEFLCCLNHSVETKKCFHAEIMLRNEILPSICWQVGDSSDMEWIDEFTSAILLDLHAETNHNTLLSQREDRLRNREYTAVCALPLQGDSNRAAQTNYKAFTSGQQRKFQVIRWEQVLAETEIETIDMGLLCESETFAGHI